MRPPRARANWPEVITRHTMIVAYHEAGKGIREINRLLGISRDTVRLWEGQVLTRPRPGRTRVIMREEDQQIRREAESTTLNCSEHNKGNKRSLSPDN
ncbi:hypothetical protein Hamer_G031635, partial [Homarus americanus]